MQKLINSVLRFYTKLFMALVMACPFFLVFLTGKVGYLWLMILSVIFVVIIAAKVL